MLELQNRVARIEEQVARLTAALGAAATPVALGDDPGTTGQVASVDLYAEGRALAAEGKKINAIKAVREQSGMSLKAAKDLVESW
jgi:ribosomal protein L7/L12